MTWCAAMLSCNELLCPFCWQTVTLTTAICLLHFQYVKLYKNANCLILPENLCIKFTALCSHPSRLIRLKGNPQLDDYASVSLVNKHEPVQHSYCQGSWTQSNKQLSHHKESCNNPYHLVIFVHIKVTISWPMLRYWWTHAVIIHVILLNFLLVSYLDFAWPSTDIQDSTYMFVCGYFC